MQKVFPDLFAWREDVILNSSRHIARKVGIDAPLGQNRDVCYLGLTFPLRPVQFRAL